MQNRIISGDEFDAGHRISTLDDVAGDRFCHPATEIENGATGVHEREEAIEPRLLEQVAAPVFVELRSMPVIQPDDKVRV